MTTLADLRNGGPTEAYRKKQLHPVPDAPVVQREPFILERCRGKVVLDVGASGPMHEAVVKVAGFTLGIAKPGFDTGMSDVVSGKAETWRVDLDEPDFAMPVDPRIELVVCGEVIEHLSNPGWFLTRLRKTYPRVPVLITVPNAFYAGQRRYLDRGEECCNRDHIAWHSPRTIQTLLEREGYAIKEFLWYGRDGQKPKFSEGMIVVAS